LEYRINIDIYYTTYAGVAGVLLHINGNFAMEKLKLFLLPSQSIFSCKSSYERNI